MYDFDRGLLFYMPPTWKSKLADLDGIDDFAEMLKSFLEGRE